MVLPALRSGQGAQRLFQRAHGGQHRGRLIAAVRHAVGTPRIAAPPVLGPVGGLDELEITASQVTLTVEAPGTDGLPGMLFPAGRQ